MSPGTMFVSGTDSVAPSRLTSAFTWTTASRVSTAFVAPLSCQKPEQARQGDDGQDDDRVSDIAQGAGDDRGDNQDDHDGAGELPEQLCQRAVSFAGLKGVRPIARRRAAASDEVNPAADELAARSASSTVSDHGSAEA